MIELDDWIAGNDHAGKPWLILGKGPSFTHLSELDVSRFHTFALNHAAAALEVDVAHAIDIEVIEALGERLLTGCRWLLMPRVPHVQNSPSLLRIEDFVAHNPVLRLLDEEGRLVVYDAATSPAPRGRTPVDVRYFSSEAAVDILGRAGARTIRSLGVDGGRSYSAAFAELSTTTLLDNGQPSFDLQFDRIDEIARRHDVDFAPVIEPIRIFIGLDQSQIVAAQVLEHSIREHASRPVRITHMLDREVPIPKDPGNRPRTGFSFSRFLIPSMCDFRGWAVYLDADMQVFADVAELWAHRDDQLSVLCTDQPEPPAAWSGHAGFHSGPQMSVMLLNCERLRWDVHEIVRGLDEGRYTYESLLFDMSIVPPDQLQATLPPTWNHLECHEPGETRLTHYTVVNTQPWRNDENPLRHVWMAGFEAAVLSRAVDRAEVEAGVRRGHLKPALLDLIPERAGSRPTPAVVLEVVALRRRLADLEGGLARRVRLRSEVWRKRAVRARDLLSRFRPAQRSLSRLAPRRAAAIATRLGQRGRVPRPANRRHAPRSDRPGVRG